MRVAIELYAGPERSKAVSKADVQRNIDALNRILDGKPPLAFDVILLMDTRGILEAIKQKLK